MDIDLKDDKQVLYVDDEKENLTVFKHAFRRYYNVFTAGSAREGLEILRNNNIKVIITDQRMPGISGVDFLEGIINKYPDPIRMILTGFSDIEAVIDAINKGRIYQYITKPWTNSEFKIIIDKALEAYELKKSNYRLLRELQETNLELEAVNQELEARLRELKSAKEKAEESDRLKSAFLANISHEFRTPLNAILGFVDILTSRNVSLEEQEEFAGYIHSNSDRLLNLITDVIDVSLLDSGQTGTDIQPFRLNSLLRDALAYAKSENNNEMIEVILSGLADESFFIYSDREKLTNIFKKLIDNALKFTKEGRIIIGYSLKGKDEIAFFVQDTGRGISKEKQALIFNKFLKINEDPLSLYEGPGLGLALSKGYVELLEGSIEVESEQEKGAKFIFTIPIQ